MKDEKAKYLIIDSTEIHKQLYKVKREYALNDFYNTYTPDRIINAEEVFSKYGIPEEFQKIIVKVSTPFFTKHEAQEYTMGFPFDITASKIERENNKKYINASNRPIFYDSQVFSRTIKFKTQFKYSNYEEVMDFLGRIDDSGYLKEYLQAIKDLFNIRVDLDYIIEVWNEEKNPQKTLKRYKEKYSHK